MKKWFTVVFCMSVFALPAQALTVEGVEIPETISINEKELKLQGAAIRSWYLVVNGYVGALHLEKPSKQPSEIFLDESRQRMTFTMLVSKMSARRIANAFYDAIQLNTTEKEQLELEQDLQLFMGMIDGSLKKGDEGVFEYIPGTGARVTIAGEEKGIIPGKKFFNAILKVWIGETPPSQRFKEEILGVTEQA